MPRRRQQPPSPPPEQLRTMGPDDPDAFPLAVVFDLDYTLWDLWIDTHISPPLKRDGQALNRLTDRRGQALAFYAEVPAILAELKRRKVHVAAASRTSAPELAPMALNGRWRALTSSAREALGLLLVPGESGEPVRAVTYFNTMEIYPGSKLRHFREIHRKTGIPYDQMLFFDDEHRNAEVEQLGVTMTLVESGTDRRLWAAGLAEWRRRRGLRVGVPDE